MILEVKSDYGKLQTFKSQTNLSMYIYVNVHMLLFYPVLEGRQYQSFETLISPFYQVHLPQSVLSQRDLLSRSRCPTQCPISQGGGALFRCSA